MNWQMSKYIITYGVYQRNIKVYKVEEIIDEFDTKTKFDDKK